MTRKSIPFLFTLPSINTPDVVFGRNYFPKAQQLPVGLPKEFRSEFEEFESAEVRGYQFWSTGCSSFHIYTPGDIENAITVFTICDTGVTINGAVVADEIIAPVFSYGELSLTFQQIYDAVTGYTGSGGGGGFGYTGSQGTTGFTGSVGFTGSRGLIGYTGSAGGGGTYTNATPVPTTLGGVVAGTTFDEVPVTEVLDLLLYPYQAPTFSSFTISGTTILEVGAPINDSRTFTWATTNEDNIVANTVAINNITTSTNIVTGTADDGSHVYDFSASPVDPNTAVTHTYRISATNTQATVFTRDLTTSWRWRMYWGTSANTSLTESEIESLVNNQLATNSSGTYTFAAGGYKYIAYPTSFGLKTTFKDQGTGFDVDMQAAVTTSVTNGNGVTTDYYVHRTTNVLGGAITITVS